MSRRPLEPSRRRARYAALFLAACMLTLITPSAVRPQDETGEIVSRRGDMISIFGGSITVPANVRQHGMVVGVGSDVVIEGEVSQDVVVILGTLTLTGSVDGMVSAILSEQHVRDARVDDQYVTVLGSVEMERTSIGDEFIHIFGPLRQDGFSTLPKVNIGDWLPGIWTFLLWFRVLRLLVIFVLLLLLASLVPERIRLIADEAPVRYVSAFFMGLLGYIAFWCLLALISVTLIGLPVALIAYYILKWMGIAGIFLAVGRRMGRSFGREMSLLGALLLTFGIYVALTLAPSPLGLAGLLIAGSLRLVFFIVVEAPAVGLVLLTRLGTRRRDDLIAGAAQSAPPPPAGPPPVGPSSADDLVSPPSDVLRDPRDTGG